MEAILRFCYGFSYSGDNKNDKDTVYHAEVYAKAEEFGLPDLKACALHQFHIASNDGLTGAQSCLQAAQTVYDSTIDSDRGLRDIVVYVVQTNFKELVAKRHENLKLLENISALTFDLIKQRAIAEADTPPKHQCGVRTKPKGPIPSFS